MTGSNSPTAQYKNFTDRFKRDSESAASRASSFSGLPTWLKWMLYALAGMLLLTIVQSIGDTDRLTSTPVSREMLRWAVPVLLAGLGGLFAERSGIVNIGLEGMMILGMWFGAWGALQFGPWIGLAVGIGGGALGGLLHAVATVTFGVDQIISGVAINILAPASTRYLSQEVWGSPTQSPRIDGIGDWDLPFLAGGSIFGWESPDILLTIGKWEWWFVSDVADILRGLLRGPCLRCSSYRSALGCCGAPASVCGFEFQVKTHKLARPRASISICTDTSP